MNTSFSFLTHKFSLNTKYDDDLTIALDTLLHGHIRMEGDTRGDPTREPVHLALRRSHGGHHILYAGNMVSLGDAKASGGDIEAQQEELSEKGTLGSVSTSSAGTT